MTSSNILSPYNRHTLERFHQGDILRNIEVVESVYRHDEEGNRKLTLQKKELEYAIIITQECDLEQDIKFRFDQNRKTDDKFMHSILLIPAYPAERVREGTHIDKTVMQSFGRDQWNLIKQNRDYRYHYFTGFLDYQVPELVADFKHYFTIPRETIYNHYGNLEHYVASLSELFRENLSIRFAQYLARIGLPEFTEPNQKQ